MEERQTDRSKDSSRRRVCHSRMFQSALNSVCKQKHDLPTPNYNDHSQLHNEEKRQLKLPLKAMGRVKEVGERIQFTSFSSRGEKIGSPSRNANKLRQTKSLDQPFQASDFNEKKVNKWSKNNSSDPSTFQNCSDPSTFRNSWPYHVAERKVTLSESSGEIVVNIEQNCNNHLEKKIHHNHPRTVFSETLKPFNKHECRALQKNEIHPSAVNRSNSEDSTLINSSKKSDSCAEFSSSKFHLEKKMYHNHPRTAFSETLKSFNKHEYRALSKNEIHPSAVNRSNSDDSTLINSSKKSDSCAQFSSCEGRQEEKSKIESPEQRHKALIRQLLPPSQGQINALNCCLLDLSDNKLLKDEDINICEEILLKINHMIRNKEDCEAVLYGSLKSGFGLTESDVNINLRSLSGRNIDMLLSFYQILKHNEDVIRLEKNMEHKPPYITFEVLDFDLQWKVRQKDDSACRTAELLYSYNELGDIRLKYLGAALRYWGKICDISEGEEGTLNSLCFPLMLIHFLQQQNPPILPILNISNKISCWESKNRKELGELWLDLLYYYGFIFNYADHVVTILQKNPLTKNEKQWNQHIIAVEEPSNKHVNVAKSVSNSSTRDFIKTCFQSTYVYFAHPQWSQKLPLLSPLIVDPDYFEIKDGENDKSEHTDDDYCYEFSEQYFTGHRVAPTYCDACTEKGHSSEECPQLSRPKLPQLPVMTASFQKKLDEFCELMYESYHLEHHHSEKRISLVSELTQHLKQSTYFDCASLDMFGSSCNGFGFVDSDVDLCLKFPDISTENLQLPQLMRGLVSHLRKNKCLKKIFLIGKAKVPIVKFIYMPNNLKGDISFSNPLGIYNSQLLNTYSKIDARCKYLGYAIRVFVRNSRLSELSTRGLTSYAYLLLIIHFLQQRDPPVLPVLQELSDETHKCSEIIVDGCNVWFYQNIRSLQLVWPSFQKNKETVGQLLWKFFQYYTEEFDRAKYVVTIRQKEPLLLKDKKWNSRFICIEDPFDVNHNLGSRVSDDVALKTIKSFHIGRQLFGTPIENVPKPYLGLWDYLLDPRVLSSGKMYRDLRCRNCFLVGHISKYCMFDKMTHKKLVDKERKRNAYYKEKAIVR